MHGRGMQCHSRAVRCWELMDRVAPGFTGIKFFGAVLRLVPFLQLFWQTQEVVS